jgi:CRISPR-associated protein Cmr3
MSTSRLVVFEPLDSLFFREAKPFNAGEGGFLDSQFPPPAQTLSGAIRGAMGDAIGIDWGNRDKVKALVGESGDDPSPLSFTGPYVFKAQQRLFPVPLCLLHGFSKATATEASKAEWQRLLPSETEFETDAGKRRLPQPSGNLEGAKQVESGWLELGEMQTVLNGHLPSGYIPAENIFVREARAGIGRNNATSVVNDAQLYFTRHLRLKTDMTLGMALSGANAPDGVTVRLGGEGRLAKLTLSALPSGLAAPKLSGKPKGLILILLTHGDFSGKTQPVWSDIHPSLACISACIGKAVREGGWDYATGKPKPLKSLVPAGSCYFVTVAETDLAAAVATLHGMHIGQRTKFGYGEIAVGLWT